MELTQNNLQALIISGVELFNLGFFINTFHLDHLTNTQKLKKLKTIKYLFRRVLLSFFSSSIRYVLALSELLSCSG